MCGNVGDLLKTFGSKGELFSFFIHSSRFSSAKFEQKGKYVVETNHFQVSILGNLLDFSQAAENMNLFQPDRKYLKQPILISPNVLQSFRSPV